MWRCVLLGAAFLVVAIQLGAQPPGGKGPPDGGGPGGFGGFKGKGPGGFGGMSEPGKILPSFLQEQLELTGVQKKALKELQSQVDSKLAQILTDKQKLRLKEMASKGPGGFPPFGKGGKGGPGGDSPIHKIMDKLAEGPESLGNQIGEALKSDAPPWDNLKAQTKEFAELVGSLAKYQPPKGSAESWAKLTGKFTESAIAMDKSVQQKNQDAALTAHKAISQSCMGCHQQHKGGPGGFGPPPGGKFD